MTPSWPLKELGLTHKIIDAYLDNTEEIQEYISHTPTLEGLIKSAEARKNATHQIDRTVLVQELSKSFNTIDDGSEKYKACRKNIASLADPNTFTITTGQQLHLFLGPAYFINKIFTCIKLVQNFNKEQSNFKGVPVFWLASEDHDTEEIQSVELFGNKFKCKLTENKITGIQETEQLIGLINELEERLGEEAANNSLFSLCKEAYLRFKTLSEATSFIIYSLFSEYGIVVIDANTPIFKKQVDTIFKEEAEKETSTVLQKKVKNYFDQQKWHYQVMPRGTNLFNIDNNGMRTIVDKAEFNSSSDYSPNAILRPLYQEAILPNIAYVGGMAETNYWLQLKPIFDHYSIPFPVIWNRDTIHIANSKKVKQLIESKFSIAEIAAFNEEEFRNSYAKANAPIQLQKAIHNLELELKKINKDIETEGWNTLLADYLKLQADIKKQIRSIKTDLLEGKKYTEALNVIEKMHNLYFSKAYLQERNKSNLSLLSNFEQFRILKETYLSSPMRHSAYYLLED